MVDQRGKHVCKQQREGYPFGPARKYSDEHRHDAENYAVYPAPKIRGLRGGNRGGYHEDCCEQKASAEQCINGVDCPLNTAVKQGYIEYEKRHHRSGNKVPVRALLPHNICSA